MTTEFHDRSEWTSTSRGGSYLSGSQLLGVACHWPGTTTSAFGIESDSEVARRLRAWRNYHVSGNEWSDIGYGLAVAQNGGAWDLRGLRRVGAHSASPSNSDANHEWIGVLFILGADEEPTGDMIEAFRRLRTEVILEEFPHATDLTGHGRAPGVPGAQTSCPGPQVAARINNGDLAERPSGEEDEMTAEQFLDALESERGQGILLSAIGEAARLGSEREGTFGRHYGDNMQRMVARAVGNLSLPRSSVEGEELGLAVARLRRASRQNVDTLGTIVQILTSNGVQLDSSVQEKIDQLLQDHENLLAELDEEEPPDLYPQGDGGDEGP